MKIQSILIGTIKIPLLHPYVSALRKVDAIEDVVVVIKTKNGLLGYGSAAATTAITGDSLESIITAISNILAPKLLGKSIIEFENLVHQIQNLMKNNTSAKAAIDIALHDLFAKRCNLPLYEFLGSGVNRISTGITIGIKSTDEMINEAKTVISQGFHSLKIKAGINPYDDLVRLKFIRQAVGEKIQLTLDVNQGWEVKQAVQIIRKIEQLNLNISMIEQPIQANDLSGLKFIRDNVETVIFADESCFSTQDAIKIISGNIADGIAIKLMKTGGISIANTIYSMAFSCGIPSMAGCMLESPIGIAAMASWTVAELVDRFL